MSMKMLLGRVGRGSTREHSGKERDLEKNARPTTDDARPYTQLLGDSDDRSGGGEAGSTSALLSRSSVDSAKDDASSLKQQPLKHSPQKQSTGAQATAEDGNDTEEQESPEEAPTAEVCMETPSIYTAVLVAVFGGVRVQMGHGRESKVHPSLLLLLCVPVFITQASSILFLRTDLDTQTPVFDPWNARSVSLLKLKLVLVIVLYLANFKNLVTAITQLVFVANPVTWVEVQRPRRDEWAFCGCFWRVFKVFFSTPALSLCAVLALTGNFLVNYIVCVDSVSIILNAESAKDAIFDSLAITFVVDLSTAWWEFCKHTFVFSPIDDYSFTIRSEEDTWTPEGWVAESRYSQLCLPRFVNALVWLTTPRCCGAQKSFLRVGHGANRVIRAVSLAILFTLYCRQLLVVLHAVDTKVLPAARDLCTEYHLMLEDTAFSKVWRGFQQITFVNMDEELADRDDMRQSCVGEDAPLKRMTLQTSMMLVRKFTHVFVIFAATVGGLLFLPTLAHASQAWCGTHIESEEDQELTQIRGEVAEVREELRNLKEAVATDGR